MHLVLRQALVQYRGWSAWGLGQGTAGLEDFLGLPTPHRGAGQARGRGSAETGLDWVFQLQPADHPLPGPQETPHRKKARSSL